MRVTTTLERESCGGKGHLGNWDYGILFGNFPLILELMGLIVAGKEGHGVIIIPFTSKILYTDTCNTSA